MRCAGPALVPTLDAGLGRCRRHLVPIARCPPAGRRKIVPAQAVYAATKNAVRTLLEGLRQESTDGVLRTTAVSPGFVRTELADSIDNPEVREQIRRSRDEFAIPPDAVARAIAFAVEQPYDVEIGDITIRPAVQG